MKPRDEFALKLNAIIESAIDGIITIDSRGIIESANDSVTGLFGFSKDEMIGQNVKMLMPEHDRSRHDTYISNYLTTKIPKIIGIGREVQGRKKDGSVFPFRLAVNEVILNDRVIFTGIVHDLSDTKRAQTALEELNKELEQKISERTDELESAINRLIKTNRKLERSEEALTEALKAEQEMNELKSRFITTASHEFRTPLSTIMSSASLISRYEKEDQQSNRLRHIEKIKRSVDHLTGVLSDFLDLSKLEEGKLDLSITEFPLEALVSSVFSELEGILKPDQKLKYESQESIILRSDKQVLKNTLFNLISNAIKYSDEGEILIKSSIERQQVMISVKDKGKGIPENDQKFLFERFFRASNVENIQGTGLGLNIVKRYVELLGGTISFTSELKIGTEFTIRIPISLSV